MFGKEFRMTRSASAAVTLKPIRHQRVSPRWRCRAPPWWPLWRSPAAAPVDGRLLFVFVCFSAARGERWWATSRYAERPWRLVDLTRVSVMW